MFKQIALAATLAVATATVPAFAYSEAAGQEWDRQYNAATVALDREDFNAFCQAEANQKALLPIVRENTAAWNKSAKQLDENLSLCAEQGRPTTANINVAQYNTAAPVASNALCAPDALGLQVYGIIPTVGRSIGCNQAQISAAVKYNQNLQQECKTRGFDKFQNGKCMMY